MRQKLPAIEVTALLSLLAGSFLLVLYRPQSERTNTYLLIHELTIENRGEGPYDLQNLSLEMALNSTTQRSYVINFTPGYNMQYDAEGNPYADFANTTIQPGHSAKVVLTLEILATVPRSQSDVDAEDLSAIPEELVERYCKEGGPFLVDNRQLQSLAHSIQERANSTNVMKIVLAVAGWIDDNVRYESHTPPLYPNDVLREQSGDCDEKANLLISLCRILKVPAYLQAGLAVESNMTIADIDGHYYSEGLVGHAWAMVYVPPWGWTPVDLTYYEATRDPISHITTSAFSLGLVIQTANIANTDYIADTKKWVDSLYAHDIYEHERYGLTTLRSETRTEYPALFIIGITLSCSGIVVTTSTMFYRRRLLGESKSANAAKGEA